MAKLTLQQTLDKSLKTAKTYIDAELAKKANSSHGNHVPAIQTANNAKFLRNDNTWQTVTPTNIGAASTSPLSNTYVEITVNGDANTYYPVLLTIDKPHIGFPYYHVSISRGYSAAAPDTWHTSTHRGGLTFSFRWSGDIGWGGNDHSLQVEEFHESYCNMVAGFVLSVDGIIVWLRGGTAKYQINCEQGLGLKAKVTLGTYTSADSKTYAVRTNTNNVANEIHKYWHVRQSGVYDNNSRVYSANNKPAAADIGALSTAGGNVTGNLTLYNSSNGATPGLIFQRGTLSDSYYDWRIHNEGGNLYFGQRTNSNSDFDKKIYFYENGAITATTFNGALNGNASSASKWQTARTLTIGKCARLADGSGDTTWALSDIMGRATTKSTGTSYVNQYAKFARVNVSAGPWTCCSGTLEFLATEANTMYGELVYYIRVNADFSSVTVMLIWKTLSHQSYTDRIVAVKAADGIYDLYIRPPHQWDTFNITSTNCSAANLLTLYSDQAYVSSVTAVATSRVNNHATYVNGLNFWTGTQAQYDALSSKSSGTVYFITG